VVRTPLGRAWPAPPPPSPLALLCRRELRLPACTAPAPLPCTTPPLPSCTHLTGTPTRPCHPPPPPHAPRLHSLGYTDISHSGYVCDERWYAITYGVR
jgi:hypothetical protein